MSMLISGNVLQVRQNSTLVIMQPIENITNQLQFHQSCKHVCRETIVFLYFYIYARVHFISGTYHGVNILEYEVLKFSLVYQRDNYLLILHKNKKSGGIKYSQQGCFNFSYFKLNHDSQHKYLQVLLRNHQPSFDPKCRHNK